MLPFLNSTLSSESVDVLSALIGTQSRLWSSAMLDPQAFNQSLEWSFFFAGVAFMLIFVLSLGYTFWVDATADSDNIKLD